jgi:hypothetical protein
LYSEGDFDEKPAGGKCVQQNLENLLLEARQEFAVGSSCQQEMKKIYAGAMDFANLDQLRRDLLETIRPSQL